MRLVEELGRRSQGSGRLVRSDRPASALILLATIVVLLTTLSPPTYAQFEFLISRLKPAIVLITVKDFLGQTGHGTGFIYDPSGLIITNHHVVEGATEIAAVLADGRSFPAVVVDYVRREEYSGSELQIIKDFAVLKIDASDLPVLPFGDSDGLRQGQEILVFGYPGGVGTEQVSVTRGIVSAMRSGWIQTDAALEPGNSGGPVVTRLGYVVGVATFVTGSFKRIGGAVAVNSVREVIASSRNAGSPRYQEFKVTGMDYVAPIRVGRRGRRRATYDPGRTTGRPTTSEYTYEVTRVDNFAGALVYAIRDDSGGEGKNYMDSSGVYQSAFSAPFWTFEYPKPVPILLFPPLAGRSWSAERTRENLSQGFREQMSETLRIEATNEVVSSPAGSFSQVLKITGMVERVQFRSGQIRNVRSYLTIWQAPGVGSVRIIEVFPDTGEREVTELVSSL